MHYCRIESPRVSRSTLHKKKREALSAGGLGHRDGAKKSCSPPPQSTNPHQPPRLDKQTRDFRVTRLQSAVIPRLDGTGMGVVKGSLEMRSALALWIVHKYEAVFLIEAELIGPAPGVIGATVIVPGGCGSAGGCPGPVAGAAGLARRVLGVLAGALLVGFRIAAVLVLGFLPWVMHWGN